MISNTTKSTTHHPRHASDPLGNNSRRELSSGDEWDMPALAPVKAKENLSWQQELLAKGGDSGRRSANNDNSRRRNESTSGLPSRPTSTRPGQANGRQQGNKPRPVLHGSLSDSTGTTITGSASGLTWQQEMLQQLGGGSAAAAQSFGALEEPTVVTPDKRNRRHQQRDAETFGLGGLSVEDAFGPLTPSRQHNQARHVSHHGHVQSPRGQAAQQASVTPTKPSEPRYAGPTFHNSPAPSSLPMPSFMLRRQAAVEAQ